MEAHCVERNKKLQKWPPMPIYGKTYTSTPAIFKRTNKIRVNIWPVKHIKSKEEGKDQESIQSNTTPDKEHHMGK